MKWPPGQEDRVFDHSWAGYDDVTYAEVDLKSETHIVHARVHEDSCAFVLRILRDFLGGHSIIEEDQAVGLHLESRTVLDSDLLT